MIAVRFDKNGFHHVSIGRLGRGERNRGMIYSLPDAFAQPGMLPRTAQILTGEVLEEALEDLGLRRPKKVEILDEEALESLISTHADTDAAAAAEGGENKAAPAQAAPRRRRRAA